MKPYRTVLFVPAHKTSWYEKAAESGADVREGFTVDDRLMARAPGAIFMHCLPMHRDEEVESAVADSPQSVVFEQAENRLHTHKALLLQMLC